MKNQWTTVSEQMDAAQQSLKDLLCRKKTKDYEGVSKNRKISIIFASFGLFLMVAGATPFLFGNNKSGFQYAADITDDFSATATPTEETFDLGLPSEESTTEEENSENTTATEEKTPSEEAETPVENTEEETTKEVVAKEETPVVQENTHAAAPEEASTQEEEIIAESVDYRENTHTGKEESPIDFRTEEEVGGRVHGAAPEEELHGAAYKNAKTGSPALPIVLVSAVSAILLRRRGKKVL